MLPTVFTVIITLLYPIFIWIARGHIEPHWLAGLLIAVAATRLSSLKISGAARWVIAATLVLALVAICSNTLLPLKLYPVLVNAGLFVAFAYSLASPPSMIERFARLREPDLPQVAIGYTRRVTQVWCVFFVLNGAIALGTALWASEALWSLYTSGISYALMGLLFGGEYLVRRRFRRLHHV
jgi:uncharacterized membrane protein